MRPSPPWDSRAARARCRQATRNSSWLQPSARARSASRATEVRRVGAFSARVRNANSATRSRPAVVVAAIRPPLAVVQTQGGVVVGQPAQLDLLGVAGVMPQHCPLVVQLRAGLPNTST